MRDAEHDSPLGRSRDRPTPSTDIATRLQPAIVRAEQALLGAVLANNRVFQDVADFLRPKHFADPINGTLFLEIAKCIAAGEHVDAITLWARVQHRSVLDDVGGNRYLSGLLTGMVGTRGVASYGRAIVDAWLNRQLIEVGEALANQAFEQGRDPRALAAIAVTQLDEAMAGEGHQHSVSFNTSLRAVMEHAAAAYQAGGVLPGLSTGMARVDRAVNGLVPANLIILGGRPGMGKSALGWKWGVHVARRVRDEMADGGPSGSVLGISLEMKADAITRRALSAASHVPAGMIVRGEFTDQQFQAMVIAERELANMPMRFEDGTGLTLGVIRMKIRQHKRKYGLSLVVVDHLHLIEPDDTGAGRATDTRSRVTQVARMLLDVAHEFDVPVLALAQLNRASASREDKRPTLTDLREAGAVEENADAVLMVHREEYYRQGTMPHRDGEKSEDRASRLAIWERERAELAGKGELIVAKMREGNSNYSVPLGFDGARMNWYEPTVAEQEVRAIQEGLDLDPPYA